ncbi:MAG: putative hydroxymethylglutaryl-CoA lyase [Massilibacillus sp.]|jgi:hydroxymethylglutaryl-CoA lyase|nr:putative hydroxymethylglutaryl-CoA lyase [Massilibacillus sp.]
MFKNLPSQIEVVEVGPRDGFQNVKTFIPTQDKLAIIDSLIAAGITEIEIGSFVSPKAIPQMADTKEICQTILKKYGETINPSVLIPNLRGAQLAWEAGIRDIEYVISVSETHNKANINQTHEHSLAELAKILDTLPKMAVRVGLATAFACPFEGWTRYDQVISLASEITSLGVNKLALSDTIGVATPDKVHDLSLIMQKAFPASTFALHLHDTRGMGLANTMAGILAGIRIHETSIGGLGGCPFAPGAAGNTSTEDVINMLSTMNISTGVEWKKLLETTELVRNKVDASLSSHMAKAKIYNWPNM